MPSSPTSGRGSRSYGAAASPTATSGSPTSSSAADGRVWLIDFGFSELAASDLLLRNDLAELVASSSLKVGPERAVAAARAAVPAGTSWRTRPTGCGRGR